MTMPMNPKIAPEDGPMGKIIFRIPGEPDRVLDSDEMREMAKIYKDLAEAIAEDMESTEHQQRRVEK